jgi:hypothetical protein
VAASAPATAEDRAGADAGAIRAAWPTETAARTPALPAASAAGVAAAASAPATAEDRAGAAATATRAACPSATAAPTPVRPAGSASDFCFDLARAFPYALDLDLAVHRASKRSRRPQGQVGGPTLERGR